MKALSNYTQKILPTNILSLQKPSAIQKYPLRRERKKLRLKEIRF